jgi:molybdopterin converting factor small subunit
MYVLVQTDTLQFLALRRKLSGRQVADANDTHKLSLDQACKRLAAQMPQPDRAVETLGQLMQVRDNHVFAAMQTALAPGASQEVGPRTMIAAAVLAVL